MNHHLTTIAALPTTAGTGSALIPERNPSRPRFELTAEDMAAAGYPVVYWEPAKQDAASRVNIVHVTIDAADMQTPSQARAAIKEAIDEIREAEEAKDRSFAEKVEHTRLFGGSL
ncbi:hypothetical protein [Variovorax sp. JS1663]|uniref:hypothetical protein n=1 Tax=Variovorax sp. JS1663 TaxID=1851577 RepID=UPI00117DBCDE|nr:hypothetical protein [Variovorax sp. JS1663]